MGDIQFPGLVVGTELSTLSEEFLDHAVVPGIPIDLALGHEYGDVFLETLIELFQGFSDTIVVSTESIVLDVFGRLS